MYALLNDKKLANGVPHLDVAHWCHLQIGGANNEDLEAAPNEMIIRSPNETFFY
jgi:hypothetical protein